MANEVKPLLKTLRYRVKDRVARKHLSAAARAVNLVWNHCNGAQRHALKHNTKWPTEGQLKRLTAGAGKLIGIPAQTIQGVCEEYIDRRRGSRKGKLRWRGKRSLGWVPFKNQTVRVCGSIVHFNGHKIRLWLHRGVEGRIKSGSFSQDARGRSYCSLAVEYLPKPHGQNAAVGIDLGLKDGMTGSTGAWIASAAVPPQSPYPSLSVAAAALAQRQRCPTPGANCRPACDPHVVVLHARTLVRLACQANPDDPRLDRARS